jgi:hypothetical protein
MAQKPIGPSTSQPPARTSDGDGRGNGDGDGAHPAAERVGPLTLQRHVKADGRALLLYARAPSTPP